MVVTGVIDEPTRASFLGDLATHLERADANASLKFVPANITVKPCQLVIWTVVGAVLHTVTAKSGATFDSGNLNEGGTFTQAFATPGTIHYYCKIHGAAMSGIITVSS